MTQPKPLLGLLRRRELLVPTWKGWLALLLAVLIAGFIVMRGTYGFLAVNDPLPGGILVLEGWSPEFTIAEALAEHQRNHYREFLVTGGPIELGNSLIDYKTYADLGAATLAKWGVSADAIHAVPAPSVERDRSYASGVAVRKWLRERGIAAEKINIVGNGSHSRRTRLVYQMAFGSEAKVGISTSPEKDFDPQRWWASSQGFKAVVGELIAYTYTRLFFSPRKE